MPLKRRKRKPDSSSPSSHQLSIALREEWALVKVSLPTHAAMLTSLLLCWSSTGSHRYCAFLSTMVLSHPENIHYSLWPLVLILFRLYLLWRSLSLVGRGWSNRSLIWGSSLQSQLSILCPVVNLLCQPPPTLIRSFSDDGCEGLCLSTQARVIWKESQLRKKPSSNLSVGKPGGGIFLINDLCG